MSAAAENFAAQLRELAYQSEVRHEQFVVFEYEVALGKHTGEAVKIALQVPPDWPASPPSGPFVSPRLLPLNPSQGRGRPWDSVHEADNRGLADPQGIWQYWSRPYTDWPNTDRTVKSYLRHLRTLFDEISSDAGETDAAAA